MAHKQAAGLLLFRRRVSALEVLLVHPGGPLWARKDEGAWSIPKGEVEPNEDALAAARREVEEETGARPSGHFIALSPVRQTGGKIVHVWNALCSDRDELIEPSSCPDSDAAIWARAGAVVEPGTGRILVATGNAPFDGKTAWGDSVLELSPDAGELVGS